MGTPQTTPDASKNTASWIGDSSNVMDFIGRFLNIKQHHQEQALSQIEGMMNLHKAGLPIDVKAFSKFVKQAKLPISMKEEDLAAFMESKKKEAGGEQAGKGFNAFSGQGTQQAQQNANAPDYAKGLISAHQKMSAGEKMDSGEVAGHFLNFLAGRARQLMNTQGVTEQAKADNDLRIETLKSKALEGDNHARGQLLSMNQIPFNLNFETWNRASDQEKNQMVEIAAGHESEGDKQKRGQLIGESLITSGRLTDPAQAYKAGTILASGGNLPPEIQRRMKPFTFSELADQSKMASSLIELGVPPDKLGHVISSAAVGGLENALPKGMKSPILEGLKLQSAQLGLEKERIGIEKTRYEKEVEMVKKAELAEYRKGITEQQKADVEQFKSLVALNKISKLDPEIIKAASIKAASALNMDVKSVNNLWHFLTGGTHLEFSPHLSDQGKSIVDQLSGKKNASPDQSTFQRTINAITGAKKEPI